jgi:hypothetical protein
LIKISENSSTRLETQKKPANSDSEIIRRAVALYKYLNGQPEKEEGR